MIIGINNVLTVVNLFIFWIAGGTIFYFNFINKIAINNTVLTIFIGIAIVTIFSVLVFCLFKFRFLWVNEKGISCFYPFRIKKKE